VRPARGEDPVGQREVDGVPVAAVLRSRDESGAALAALSDGRYVVVGSEVIAIGGRRAVADWCEKRAEREGIDAAERAWWQEVTGALIARG
jgi:hypothetical protein